MTTLTHDPKNEEEIYFNFINSIKSEVTKETYEKNIKSFMKFCNVTKLSDLLLTDTQKQIVKYLMSLREKGLSYNTLSLSLCAIYHFYEMNDVVLNKKKINMFKGEFKKFVDRAYTDKEIKKILDISDLRMKSIILLMASSGIRIGAIPLLRLRNIEKVDSVYKIIVYEGTNEQYYTFCTLECTCFIDAYLEYRNQNGENLHKDSFLIRDQFDITDIEQVRNRSKGITLHTIKVIVNTALIKSGVKVVNHTSNYTRQDVSRSHGFRKFFTTQCVKSLKIQFNETTDYESVIEQSNRHKVDYEYRMFVVPISFAEYGKELLGRFQHLVSNNWFSLSSIEHSDLVTQMRMARFKDNGNLEKDEKTANNTFDVFDSTRLALKMYEMGERRK